MAPTTKKKTNFWEDPTFQAIYTSQLAPGLAGRNAEQARLKDLNTNIYGATGALATNKIDEANAQNRLAEEMAMKGRLHGGAYAGPQKGRGTLLQADYANQRRGVEQGYAAQTNPMNLLAQGLKMNPDGSISPLAEGENMIDPITGKQKKFSVMEDTSYGNKAKSAALMQYLASRVNTQV